MPVAVSLQNINKEFPARRGETPTKAVDNVNLEIEHGEFFSMLGPSGCGKTTTLRMIAGFEEPSSGVILLDGVEVSHVPPFHRQVNTVFQDYALFPHMTVKQNVAFGLQMARVPANEIEGRVKKMLELVQLPQMENRYPRQLSGGQQQRVALARALVKEPKVLLLDEPLGALDLKLRKQMQLELKHMQRRLGITFIYVTHDQEEALTMSDRIAVMSRGKVLQVGKPMDIYNAPTNRFVADFIGETNFLPGNIKDAANSVATVNVCGQFMLKAKSQNGHADPGANVTVAVRPEKLDLRPMSDPTSNYLVGHVDEQIFIGTDTRYVVRLPDNNQIVARVQNGIDPNEQTFAVGDEVKVVCQPEHTLVLEG
jgi:spermidine/putrescine transport system ATP-binding protein